MDITCVTIDCHNPVQLATFWSHALGWNIAHAADEGAYCHPSGGGPGLELIRVTEPKTSKNRVHLGTHADDLDSEIARLIALGATVAWEEDFPAEWPYRNVVLRDPEGNEFCLGNEPRR